MRFRAKASATPRQAFRPPASARTPAAPQRGSDYAQLSRQVKQAGLLERRPGRYVGKITVTAALLAAGWALFVVVGDSWWQLAVAVFLAVMFTQAGFLGHDAGHRQVLTSRNVRGGWFTDLVLGGLNYQIEHHLFPSMPRPNLRRSQALIKQFCQQRGLPYCEASFGGSYAQALRYLNMTGRPPRTVARPPVFTTATAALASDAPPAARQ